MAYVHETGWLVAWVEGDVVVMVPGSGTLVVSVERGRGQSTNQ